MRGTAVTGSHSTTRGEDLFERLNCFIDEKIGLEFEMLSDLTTDGARAMVGSQKGLIPLVKKKTESSQSVSK